MEKNNPTSVIYVAPSVTTLTNHNPAFRIYEYNSQFELLNYHQFIANLTLANQINRPTWFLEYSAVEEYKLKDMSPSSWLDLVNRFETDDNLFQRWFLNHFTLTRSVKCEGECKKDSICNMLSATVDLNAMCSQK